MSDFNISEFIKIMQEGLAENNTQEFAGRLLLESVTQQEGVCVDVNSKMISNIVNQKSEVPYAIKKPHQDKKSLMRPSNILTLQLFLR